MQQMGYGDGSLFQRTTGKMAGRWVKRWQSPDGAWHETSWESKPTAPMQRSRLRKLNEAWLKNSATPPPPSETLAAFLRRWLRDGTTDLRSRTVNGYRVHVGHIAESLGDVPLHDLTALDVQEWLNDGASSHSLAVLRAALSQAVRWNLIPVNPARAARPRKVLTRERAVLTPEQARALLAQVKGDPLEALWVLAVYTGMRQGEVLGLRWQDVSLKDGTLNVATSLWWRPTPGAKRNAKRTQRPVLTEPKTERSRRRISLAPPVVAALSDHKRLHFFASKDGLVFTTPEGTPLRPWGVLAELKAHLAAAGLPAVTFHSLRHAAATSLIASGAPVTSVSKLLGHSNVTTTMNIYAHAVEDAQRDMADRMADLLRVREGG